MEYLSDQHYEVASQNGICYQTVYNRVNRQNWTVEKAITQPINLKHSSVSSDRYQWQKWKKVALENGVYNQLYVKRIKKHNWSPEKAATTPVRRKSV